MKISNDSAPSSIHRPNTAVGAHYLRLAADRGSPEAQVPPSPPRTRTRFVLAVGRSDGRGRGQCWLATVLMDVAGWVALAEGVAGTVTDAGGMGLMGKMG